MDTRTVFASALLIILILLIVITWKSYPYAKYIVLARADGESKYIAVNNLEVIDSRGGRHDIIAIEGKSQLTTGSSSAAGALAATPTLDVTFNGRNMGYFKETINSVATAVGPVIAALPGAAATSGYIIFTLGCPASIARINIKAVDDDTSRLYLQRVKVYLLDKDKNIIEGAEQIIPISGTIPSTMHHISFV